MTPEILPGLLFYGYVRGVLSFGKLEKGTYESIRLRFSACCTARISPGPDQGEPLVKFCVSCSSIPVSRAMFAIVGLLSMRTNPLTYPYACSLWLCVFV